MALPDLIEIIPPAHRVAAQVALPGSKSVTNRALILAALARGRCVLRDALWSEDTQVMVGALQRLGLAIETGQESDEPGNRRITVVGQNGRVPPGGSADAPLDLYVGNAGTAARFLAALLCLGKGVYRLSGVARMHERPQAALFAALRQLGYSIESPNDRLPALIHGGGRRPGACQVSVDESSQFASALLLCSEAGGWRVEVTGANTEELPYVEMSRQLLKHFPRTGGEFTIEPDASSGSYFVGANWLLKLPPAMPAARPVFGSHVPQTETEIVLVRNWPRSEWQIDSAFPRYLPLPRQLSRERDLGDSIMTAIVLAPFTSHPVRFTELGRLRVQECERVKALETELSRLGAKVTEEGDSLMVEPSALHGAQVRTYNDHRMAMCLAILGLKVPGIKIENPGCVKKTFPNFFQKLSAPEPAGLGVTIVDGRSGRKLAHEELEPE